MDRRSQIAWLYRRAGFGLAEGELDSLEKIGVESVIDRLVDGDAHGLEPNPDPWAGVTFHDYELEEFRGEDRRAAVAAWFRAMRDTPRPLEEWVRWFWHGHLVSSVAGVGDPQLMVQQLRLYGDLGLGNFRELLYRTTIDPAMLVYLDGRGSSKEAPNENYAREVLELFGLGFGNYTEADIKAGAAALTGWRVLPAQRVAIFDARIHDDTPRTYLGVDGVHDAETVIAAITSHEACPRWIALSLAEAILGAGVDSGLVESLAESFRSENLELRPLLRRILEAGVEGAGQPMVLRPVPWLVQSLRATGSRPEVNARQLGSVVVAMGQVPMAPPNVAGWPGDESWLTSSVTVGRINAASLIAATTPAEAAAHRFARDGELDGLADALGRPDGFGDSTKQALREAASAGGREGDAVLAVALASPEMVQA